MRDAFVAELTALAERDKSIILLTGDLGFGVLTEFARRFPAQYLNAGVAEQNMAGLAAGLALEGRRVFTYSIANFPTLRCLEQIRNDICYHNLPVTVVAVGGGFAYGPLGFSHHATEDVAVMGALPGMRVMAPNDPAEAKACTAFAGSAAGPSYLRLGRNGERSLHFAVPVLAEAQLIPVRTHLNPSVCVIGACGALDIALDTADLLGSAGAAASVWSSPFIHPFDHEGVQRMAQSSKLVVTIEEHCAEGGLGSRCAHAIASLPGSRAQLLACGIAKSPTHVVGDQAYMRKVTGLNAPEIHKSILQLLRLCG